MSLERGLVAIALQQDKVILRLLGFQHPELDTALLRGQRILGVAADERGKLIDGGRGYIEVNDQGDTHADDSGNDSLNGLAGVGRRAFDDSRWLAAEGTAAVRDALRLLLTLLFLAIAAASNADDSQARITLHQDLLNHLARSALPHVATRSYTGEVGIGAASRPWSIEVRYTMDAIELTVAPDAIRVRARVRAQGTGLDYTTVASGRFVPTVRDGCLCLELVDLQLPLRVAPLGFPIDLGNIPAADFVPDELRRLRIELDQLGFRIPLPGGRTVGIRPAAPRFQLAPPHLIIGVALTPG